MKKMYITPLVETKNAMPANMIALSIQPNGADESEVLVEEEFDLFPWIE